MALAMVLAGAVLGAACDDNNNAACDPATRSYCLDPLDNLGAVACGDVATGQMCTGTQWVCPSGTVPQDECDCKGPPPGTCTCTTTGWSCP
jgi:hypothetical protein